METKTKFFKKLYDGDPIMFVIDSEQGHYLISERFINLYSCSFVDPSFVPATREEAMTAFYAAVANLTKNLPI